MRGAAPRQLCSSLGFESTFVGSLTLNAPPTQRPAKVLRSSAHKPIEMRHLSCKPHFRRAFSTRLRTSGGLCLQHRLVRPSGLWLFAVLLSQSWRRRCFPLFILLSFTQTLGKASDLAAHTSPPPTHLMCRKSICPLNRDINASPSLQESADLACRICCFTDPRWWTKSEQPFQFVTFLGKTKPGRSGGC